MTQTADNETSTVVPLVSRAGRLADALARTRARQEAQTREAFEQREGRMAMLTRELDAIAEELPEGETGQFEMVASHTGDRLVIDPLSYVDLDDDSNAYRLIRKRRDGEQTVLQSVDHEEMADGIASYMAERIVEREGLAAPSAQVIQQVNTPAPVVRKGLGFWGGFWLFILGGLCAAAGLFAYAWQSYPAG